MTTRECLMQKQDRSYPNPDQRGKNKIGTDEISEDDTFQTWWDNMKPL